MSKTLWCCSDNLKSVLLPKFYCNCVCAYNNIKLKTIAQYSGVCPFRVHTPRPSIVSFFRYKEQALFKARIGRYAPIVKGLVLAGDFFAGFAGQ